MDIRGGKRIKDHDWGSDKKRKLGFLFFTWRMCQVWRSWLESEQSKGEEFLRACTGNHHNILFASKDLEACFGRRTHHHPHHLTHQFAPPKLENSLQTTTYLLKLQFICCPFVSSNIFTLNVTLHHGCLSVSISCQWMIQFSAAICGCV